jgi:hypothetical protein
VVKNAAALILGFLGSAALFGMLLYSPPVAVVASALVMLVELGVLLARLFGA